MKTSTLLLGAATALVGFAAPVHAECFAMYDARNALVYQSVTSPIDLSRPVSEQMAARFPGRALVISTTTFCGSSDDGRTADTPRSYSDFSSTSAAPRGRTPRLRRR